MAKREISGFNWVDGSKGDERTRAGISHWYSPNTMVLYVSQPGVGFPAAYVRKPKFLSDEDWATVKAALRERCRTLPAFELEDYTK